MNLDVHITHKSVFLAQLSFLTHSYNTLKHIYIGIYIRAQKTVPNCRQIVCVEKEIVVSSVQCITLLHFSADEIFTY